MNEEDCFVDDIINNIKSKKKKLNSKDKGKRGERDLCKVLTKRFPDHKGFFRVMGSGSLGGFSHLTEQAKEIFTGDIVCPEGFKFSIECKYGYDDIDLCTALEDGNKTIDKFLSQAEKDAERVKKKPLLCWKKPRQNWLAFFKIEEVCRIEAVYKLIYRDWICLPLTKVVTMPDTFFFTA